jgi:aspartyl protease family protein
MFGRVISLAAVCAALALAGSSVLLNRLPERPPVSASAAAGAATNEARLPDPPPRESAGYREALLEANPHGQYTAEVLIDGSPVWMLVDTGATLVCVSASTARRLGLSPSGARERLIQTANGQSTAEPTTLSNVSFDGLYMNNVEALILAPEAGDVNLLGMSFLKRLMSVEQRNGALVLRQ